MQQAKLAEQSVPTVIDLFSGAGGMAHCVIHKSKTLYKSITYKRQKIEQWDSCGLRESL